MILLRQLWSNGPQSSLLRLFRSSLYSTSSHIEPPLKRYRDHTSVLRSLASCVEPDADAPDFRLGGDPWLGSPFNSKTYLLSRAKGRLAARLAVRDYFPNDIAALANELPRIDRLLPIISPSEVMKQFVDGSISAVEAMDHLIHLLAPKQAWKLYNELAPDENWSPDIVHSLLDLLCATNSGQKYDPLSPIISDISALPDADELFFADEFIYSKSSRFVPNTQISNDDADIEEVPATTLDFSESGTTEALPCGVWSLHSPAEKLFYKETSKLRTPAAYCSLIRGASKFKNPERALRLAEAAWDTVDGASSLDVSTYAALLGGLHHLNEPHFWSTAQLILERFVSSKQPPDLNLFASVLYALSESCINVSKTGDPKNNELFDSYVSIAISLLDEVCKLGLEPSLSVLASVLKVVHFAGPGSKHMASDLGWYSYRVSPLLESFVSQLNYRFQMRPLSPADSWNTNDSNFFAIAMRIALMEHNRALGEKINDLLVRYGDCRFMLSSSQLERAYVYHYVMLKTSNFRSDLGNPLPFLLSLERLYRLYRQIIVTTTRLFGRFTNVLDTFLSHSSQVSSTAVTQAQLVAYKIACQLFCDLLAKGRLHFEFHNRKNIQPLIRLIKEYSCVDPLTATNTSVYAFQCFNQTLERTQSSKLTPNSEASYKNPNFIGDLIELHFPAALHLTHHSNTQPGKSINHMDTLEKLRDSVLYAVKQEAVSWTWAPLTISLLLNSTVELDMDEIWRMLQQLSMKSFKPSSVGDAEKAQDLFVPILTYLNHCLSNTTTNLHLVDQQKVLLQQLREQLHDAHKNTSTGSDSSEMYHARFPVSST